MPFPLLTNGLSISIFTYLTYIQVKNWGSLGHQEETQISQLVWDSEGFQ